MKTTVAPYQTAVTCVRIVCTSGLTVRLTAYPHDLTMSNATVYKTDYGYEPTAYSATATLSPSAIDLEGVVAAAGVARDTLASGVFDNARVYVFKCDFLNPVEDHEPVSAGFFGKTTRTDDRYRVEAMSLVDALNQTAGRSYGPACGWTFGDANCTKELSTLDVTGTLTAVTSNRVVRDSARAEAVDAFVAGTLQFTSGANAGLKPLEIKSYAADGTITTIDAFYFTPAIGDTYVMLPGCRKRRADCIVWHGHADHFGGFPDMPTTSAYMEYGARRG